MSLKTKWEGLWKQRDGVYSSYVLKKEDIPPYSKLIVRHNKYYEKDSTKPRFIFCFANGDSEKAITLKTEKEDFISMIEMSEKFICVLCSILAIISSAYIISLSKQKINLSFHSSVM